MRNPYSFLVKMHTGISCFTFYSTKFSCHNKNHSFLLLPKEVASHLLGPSPDSPSTPFFLLVPSLQLSGQDQHAFLFVLPSLYRLHPFTSTFPIKLSLLSRRFLTLLLTGKIWGDLKDINNSIVWARSSDSLYIENRANSSVKKLWSPFPLLKVC